jgi:uncharacterized protein (TIGR03790 family)
MMSRQIAFPSRSGRKQLAKLMLARVILNSYFRIESRKPLTRASATLSPSDGERDGVKGRSEIISDNRSRILSLLLLVLGIVPLWAGESGLNTIVIINQASPDSLALGNYYCERRAIPPENVLKVNWTGSKTIWTDAEFTQHLRMPLAEMLAHRNLTNQINLVVLSMDLPFTTDVIAGGATNRNSTTSALFYGTKPASAGATDLTNRYDRSELPFIWVRSNAVPALQFLTTQITAGSLAQARQLVDQGVQSDGKFPLNPVLLAKSSDPDRNLRHFDFDNAIFNHRILGFDQLFRTNSDSPQNATGLLGYQTGLAQYQISSNSFVPGAIADSMTSFGGIIIGANGQTRLLEFIHAGASGSYGTVAEPLSDVQKFPNPMVYFYQSRGFNLAEAYYQSLAVPYQGLIVGEPLAAPFARPGSGKWSGSLSNTILSGTVPMTIDLHARDASRPLQQVDLFVDGKFHSRVTNLPPAPGNVLHISLNGYPLRYTVPAAASLASIVTDLANLLNQTTVTTLTKIKAQAHGDRLELQSFGDDRQSYPFYLSNFIATPPTGLEYRVAYLPDTQPAHLFLGGLNPAGQFQMHFEIPNQRVHWLEASTNLFSWQRIYTNTISGVTHFRDPESHLYPHRFYRLAGAPASQPPQLAALGFLPSQKFRLELQSVPGQAAAILTSTNQFDWTGLVTNWPGGPLTYDDTPPGGLSQRFYRAMLVSPGLPTLTENQLSAQASLLQITNPAQPYVIQFRTNNTPWQTLTTNFAFREIQLSAHSSLGSASNLTTFIRTPHPTFRRSEAHGIDEYKITAIMPLAAGAWLQFTFTKTNGAVVTVGITNQIAGNNPTNLAAQIVNLINAHPDLQGDDGVAAEDFVANSVFAGFTLRARSPGYAAAQLNAHARRYGVTISPSSSRPLMKNAADLQSRHHLYLTAGALHLNAQFPLDTTTLPDGHHELTAVAYEGSHVRTQTRATIPICISNSPLAATLDLGLLTNNSPAQGLYSVQVNVNTNNVNLVTLHSTGGPIAFATNNSNPTFSVIASNLWIGRHPFYATVETVTGQKYRTPTSWIRLQ